MSTNKPDHSSRGHHPQGPSALKTLQTCPGFENRAGTSAAAEMGTRIHEALEVRDPSNLLSELELELYDKCVAAEDKLIPQYFGDEEYDRFNELPLTVPLNGGLEIWGTGDVFCVNKSRTKGLMIDYKTGRMKVDPAEVNLQGRAYKNGGFNEFPSLEEIRFIFLAPQIDWISYHDFDAESVDVDRFVITTIVSKAQDYRERWLDGSIMEDHSDLNPSDNCQWCRHAQYCPAIHGVLFDFAHANKIELPHEIDVSDLDDPDELAELYRVVKILEPLINKIKRRAVEMGEEGEVLPGWELRSMGSKRLAADNRQFWDYCEAHGLTVDDLLDNVNIPVAKLRDILSAKAPRGKKGAIAKQFIDEGIDSGVIVLGKERLTLKPETADD